MKHSIKKPDGPASPPVHGPGTSLIVLSAFFLCGTVAGCLTAFHVDGPADGTLQGYLRDLLSAAGGQTGGLWWSAFVNAFKYHLAVFVLGLTLPGLALIPAAMVVRGFSLSFAVAALARGFGWNGLLLALGAFGVQALLALPCLFALAEAGLQASLSMLGAVRGQPKRPGGRALPTAYFLRFLLFAVILIASALFEALAVPPIVRLIAGQIS